MTPIPADPAHPKHEDTRSAILHAATEEFAQQGEAGARTDAIARAAGVNKALIHYYFGTKEALYIAVLDQIFTGLAEGFFQVLKGPGTPGERVLKYFLAHFDHLAREGAYTRLMGHEMMRAKAGEPSRISQIVKVAFGPVRAAVLAAMDEGLRGGEFRALDEESVFMSLTGANVFYFISASFARELSGKGPRDPERLARQRAALLDFAATVLFSDPGQGRELAQRIHSENPFKGENS